MSNKFVNKADNFVKSFKAWYNNDPVSKESDVQFENITYYEWLAYLNLVVDDNDQKNMEKIVKKIAELADEHEINIITKEVNEFDVFEKYGFEIDVTASASQRFVRYHKESPYHPQQQLKFKQQEEQINSKSSHA